jgi:methylamine dehydrogenase heavy chain
MQLKWQAGAAALMAAIGMAGAVAGGDPLPPETLVMKPKIDSDGPLFFTGGERLLVADVEGFKWQAVIGMPGRRGQYLVTPSGQVILTNSWWDRGTTGNRTDIIEVWDVPTASKLPFEIEVPSRLALRGNDSTMIGLSSDEKFLFLQNATPATSVTVVDMVAKKFMSEIPMPGCFGIYPAARAPGKFVALCGDGTAATVTVDARGKSTGAVRSSAFFDADADPLFPKAARDGDTLYFASFNGTIYEVDISGATASLVRKFSIVKDVAGGWKPASENLLALVPDGKVLYVSMFPKSGNGDHRVAGKEIWAVDLAAGAVLSRSTVSGSANGIAYAPKPVPALIVNDSEAKAVDKYIIQPKAGYALYFDKQWVVESAPNIMVR